MEKLQYFWLKRFSQTLNRIYWTVSACMIGRKVFEGTETSVMNVVLIFKSASKGENHQAACHFPLWLVREKISMLKTWHIVLLITDKYIPLSGSLFSLTFMCKFRTLLTYRWGVHILIIKQTKLLTARPGKPYSPFCPGGPIGPWNKQTHTYIQCNNIHKGWMCSRNFLTVMFS